MKRVRRKVVFDLLFLVRVDLRDVFVDFRTSSDTHSHYRITLIIVFSIESNEKIIGHVVSF